MEKLILKDGTEIEIQEGATLNSVIVFIDEYDHLKTLAGYLTDANLDAVEFVSNDIITGLYEKMALKTPNFYVTQLDSGRLQVVFGLRQKTQQELLQDDVQAAIAYLTDEQALTVASLYPKWKCSGAYAVGDRRNYNDILYKCLQDHTAQEEWNPEAAPSIWAPILIPDPEVVPTWVQPESTNGYSAGDKVIHNDKTWESLVDNNVWEPGAEGTESLWKEVE